MICKNCGAELKSAEKFCGKCGTPAIDENKMLQTNSEREKKVPKKHLGIKVIAVTLALLILLNSVGGVLVYYRIVDIPMFSSVFNTFGIGYHTKDTNTSNFTYHMTTKDHIKFDSATGVGFVDNELLLTTNENISTSDIITLVDTAGGTIVGEIASLNHYQLQFEGSYSYAELKEIISELSASDLVSAVNFNYAFPIDTGDYTPNDREWKKDWDETPSGNNWALETIEAQKAWDHKDKMQSVNIGVIDTMFYTDHEDLEFAETPLGNIAATNSRKEFNSHGTHVSGIIGATFDNDIGIAGITPTSNIYGASVWGLCDYGYSTTLTYKLALFYLIEANNCKVINISMGSGLLEFCATQEINSSNKPATEAMRIYSDEISEFLEILINKGYEFVICVCAGNQNDGAYKYFKKDDNDTQIPYDYYSYDDFQKYLSGEEATYNYLNYKDRIDEIKAQLIEAKNINANGMFAMIEDSEVRDRIIITGAVQNNGGNDYSIASFSQCGSEVDILAPGVDIYSTVNPSYKEDEKGWVGTNLFRKKYNYLLCTGTSQAAPIATAVTGLVFSINPDLTGAEVKNIVCSSGVGSYGKEKYKLINANNAVEKALDTFGDSSTTVNGTNSNAIMKYKKALEELSTQYGRLDNETFSRYISGNVDLEQEVGWANVQGIIGEYIADLNHDGKEELLVIRIAKNNEQQTQQIIEVYETEDEVIKLTNSKKIAFGVLGNMEDMYIGTYIANINNKTYVCIENVACGIYADYSCLEYHILGYTEQKIDYEFLIRDTYGGTGGYEYTMYTWDESGKEKSEVVDSEDLGYRLGKYCDEDSPLESAFAEIGFPAATDVITKGYLFLPSDYQGYQGPSYLNHTDFTALSLYETTWDYAGNNGTAINLSIHTQNMHLIQR